MANGNGKAKLWWSVSSFLVAGAITGSIWLWTSSRTRTQELAAMSQEIASNAQSIVVMCERLAELYEKGTKLSQASQLVAVADVGEIKALRRELDELKLNAQATRTQLTDMALAQREMATILKQLVDADN